MVHEAASRHCYRYILNASATTLPFSDASFPTVVSNCVIEHIPDLDRTLAEISRILRPGGRFIFGVPSDRFAEFFLGSTLLRQWGVPGLAAEYGGWFNRHSRHYHSYSPQEWEQK